MFQQQYSGPHEITDELRAACKSIFDEVGAIPDACKITDEDLIYRFIIAHKGDKDVARTTLKEYIDWRSSYKTDNIRSEPFPHEIADLWPCWFYGKDKKGNPLYFEKPNQTSIRTLLEKFDAQQLVRWHIYTMECGRALYKSMGKDRITVVFDLSGVGMSVMLDRKVLALLKENVKSDQAMYPEHLHTMFIINAPGAFTMLWKMIVPLLDPRVRKKIHIADKHYLTEMQEYIDVDQLPKEFGGTANAKPLQAQWDPLAEVSLTRRRMSKAITQAMGMGGNQNASFTMKASFNSKNLLPPADIITPWSRIVSPSIPWPIAKMLTTTNTDHPFLWATPTIIVAAGSVVGFIIFVWGGLYTFFFLFIVLSCGTAYIQQLRMEHISKSDDSIINLGGNVLRTYLDECNQLLRPLSQYIDLNDKSTRDAKKLETCALVISSVLSSADKENIKRLTKAAMDIAKVMPQSTIPVATRNPFIRWKETYEWFRAINAVRIQCPCGCQTTIPNMDELDTHLAYDSAQLKAVQQYITSISTIRTSSFRIGGRAITAGGRPSNISFNSNASFGSAGGSVGSNNSASLVRNVSIRLNKPQLSIDLPNKPYSPKPSLLPPRVTIEETMKPNGNGKTNDIPKSPLTPGTPASSNSSRPDSPTNVDKHAKACAICNHKFTFRRRHFCVRCGRTVCSDCSTKPVSEMIRSHPKSICVTCEVNMTSNLSNEWRNENVIGVKGSSKPGYTN
eukprot:NODE_582_length_2575_cov_57.435155_g497_i0.p1 GENE.NODE_582_length_2575_cov_57.435155_g497_i0~~NODE_582_length_2575_cov_57.435155_g497_i0.p1  ORF type:complete len:732 (-),score=117.64 NODE_582_length_2575_cov_57.435155_g497_i0:223-2418(-)